MGFKPIDIIKNQFDWAKKHPVEAVLLGAGVGVGASFLPAMFAAEAGGAGTLALETGGPAMLGADAATGVSLGAEAAGAGAAGAGESALLSGYAPEMLEGYSGAAGAGGYAPEMLEGYASASLAPYAAPSADPAMLGGNTPLSSPYSGWWDKATATVGDKLKDPKTVMHLGMMAANMANPRQQGGPAAYPEAPSMRSASHSQEDITKAWLLRNDPNTYRRIYGNPQGVA